VSALTLDVLAVLVDDRHRAIARDFRHARHLRLRRRIATVFHAIAGAVDALATALDEKSGTIEA
jgi:transcriptional regulator of met regulon